MQEAEWGETRNANHNKTTRGAAALGQRQATYVKIALVSACIIARRDEKSTTDVGVARERCQNCSA